MKSCKEDKMDHLAALVADPRLVVAQHVDPPLQHQLLLGGHVRKDGRQDGIGRRLQATNILWIFHWVCIREFRRCLPDG